MEISQLVTVIVRVMKKMHVVSVVVVALLMIVVLHVVVLNVL
jgi:hypothetical protein